MKMKRILRDIAIVLGASSACSAAAWGFGAMGAAAPTERHLAVVARQYAYEPPRIRVNEGDQVHLRLASKDVIHGFYLEGHDLDAEIRPQQKTFTVRHPQSNRGPEQVEEISFVASRRGKFRYRCSHTCGTLHPFMTGELIVGPNTPLHAGVGAVVGLFIGALLTAARRGPQGTKG